jgi:hypothetical protein
VIGRLARLSFAGAAFAAALAGAALTVSPARAEMPRLGLRGGVSHAVGAPQADDFGFGGAAELAAELRLVSILAVEARAGALLLAPSDAPPGQPARSLGTIELIAIGPKLRPLGADRPDGPWLGLGAGLAINGSSPRFGGGGELGWDFALGDGRFAVGPFVAYTHVLEPGTDRSSEADAHILWGGVGVSFGAPKKKVDASPLPTAEPEPVLDDGDGDGIKDKDDACPNVRGVRTHDDNTNGCPPKDTDKDGVPDDEDACPNLPGKSNEDARKHGCPDVLPKPEEPPAPEKKKEPDSIELD